MCPLCFLIGIQKVCAIVPLHLLQRHRLLVGTDHHRPRVAPARMQCPSQASRKLTELSRACQRAIDVQHEETGLAADGCAPASDSAASSGREPAQA